jgi:hypothetical protein
MQIELRGNLAAMLGATVQTKRSPESDDLSLQVSLVAGGLATNIICSFGGRQRNDNPSQGLEVAALSTLDSPFHPRDARNTLSKRVPSTIC